MYYDQFGAIKLGGSHLFSFRIRRIQHTCSHRETNFSLLGINLFFLASLVEYMANIL